MKTDTKITAELRELITEKDNEIAHLKQQVIWLTEQFKLMQSRQFGASSEKTMDSCSVFAICFTSL